MKTPYMEWPYPIEDQQAFYSVFLSFIRGVDLAALCAVEDRNMSIFGGGLMSFNAGTFTWGSSIYLAGMISGFKCEISASSKIVEDGDVLYVEFSRYAAGNVVVGMSSAKLLGVSYAKLMIGHVFVDRIVFRNGLVLIDGDTNIELFNWGGRFETSSGAIHGSDHVATGSDPIPGIEQGESIYACAIGDSVGDVVYQMGDAEVAKADNGNWSTMPAIGFIKTKITTISALICQMGDFSIAGLIPDTTYYVDVAGAITNVVPATPGQIKQVIGFAKTANILHVYPSIPIEVS